MHGGFQAGERLFQPRQPLDEVEPPGIVGWLLDLRASPPAWSSRLRDLRREGDDHPVNRHGCFTPRGRRDAAACSWSFASVVCGLATGEWPVQPTGGTVDTRVRLDGVSPSSAHSFTQFSRARFAIDRYGLTIGYLLGVITTMPTRAVCRVASRYWLHCWQSAMSAPRSASVVTRAVSSNGDTRAHSLRATASPCSSSGVVSSTGGGNSGSC